MPKITDTYALAYECCDQVLLETERFPTIDSIRERIGVNSPTTIKKAINDWTVAFARKHFEKMHRPELPTALLDAAEALWYLALKQAEHAFQAQVLQHQEEMEVLKQQRVAMEQMLVERDNLLSTTQQRFDDLEQRHQALNTAYIDLQQEQQALQQQYEGSQQELLQLKQSHKLELEQIQVRREQDADWYQRRIVEERELQTEKWQRKVTQLEELNQALQQSAKQAMQNTQQCRESYQALQQHCQQLETALAAAQQPVTEPIWRRKRKLVR